MDETTLMKFFVLAVITALAKYVLSPFIDKPNISDKVVYILSVPIVFLFALALIIGFSLLFSIK